MGVNTENPPGPAPRILICEDEYLIASSLALELEELGASIVGWATTVEHAMELALQATLELDVAVLEVRLARESAYPVVRAFRQRDVGIVFYSGHTRRLVPEEFAELPFISKPADPATIYEAVLLACGRGS